jgi:ABC-type methionine transport system ATPase subunit
MRSLAATGSTMIVTREMEFARQVAGRVVFSDVEQIVESGQPARLFSSPETPRARQFLARFHGRQEVCAVREEQCRHCTLVQPPGTTAALVASL